MYAEIDLLSPYFQNFSQEFQQLDHFCQKSDVSMDSGIFEYDMGGEGDLFKAPEPIIEEVTIGSLDPVTTAVSMISCGNDLISSEAIRVADIESTNEQLLSEVFYECKKDILAQSAMEAETSLSDVFDLKLPVTSMADNDSRIIEEGKFLPDVSLQKSVSSGCLSSMEWVNGSVMRPNFLDFPGIDFEAVYGMRRAFSEGDIKTLGNDNDTSLIYHERPLVITSCTIEERKHKLNRYRNKKAKRNFGRKIKYACRKALADSQPRIRGRFAKTDDSEISKK